MKLDNFSCFAGQNIKGLLFALLSLACFAALNAQTHTRVEVENDIYKILEAAEMRGLCAPLPALKPYTRSFVKSVINEILANDALTRGERAVLENYAASLTLSFTENTGLDLSRGRARLGSGKGGAEIAMGVSGLFSASVNDDGGAAVAFEVAPTPFSIRGDIGERFSYGFEISLLAIYNDREKIGSYNTYYEGFPNKETSSDLFHYNRLVDVYPEPPAFFPFSYKRRWDSYSLFGEQLDNSGQLAWPEGLSLGYYSTAEIAANLLDERLFFRFGRFSREVSAAYGQSLALNRSARPFYALDTQFRLLPNLLLTMVSGGLELDTGVLGDVEATTTMDPSFQNMFWLSSVEFNYKNYLHLSAGSTAVYAKRPEWGYIFPDPTGWHYQGNIGDYDNMGTFANVRFTLPRIGRLWVQLFVDEANPERGAASLDREMFAYQAGIAAPLPFLSFTEIKLSYTKIEPYCYTHTRDEMPWYGDNPMARAYLNNGKGLGYYLPPNSDELLLRLETSATPRSRLSLQYQMIRHGADHGPNAVDGSSYLSELSPIGRSDEPVLKKFFLEDGAYQWFHIIKAGASVNLGGGGASLPSMSFFADVGAVISYYTNIDGPANSGSPSGYRIVNTSDYPKRAVFIVTLGFTLFPRL